MTGHEPALARLLTGLEHAGSPLPTLLQPGLSGEEMARLAAEMPFGLPDALGALYRWRNGAGSRDVELFPGGYWLALEEALALRGQQLMIAASAAAQVGLDPDVLWRITWLPVFIDLGGNAYVVVCEQPSESPVWFVAGDDPDDRQLEYDSIAALIDTVAACSDEDVLSWNAEGIEAHESHFRKVWQTLNPVAAAGRRTGAGDLAHDLKSPDPDTRERAAHRSGEGADAAPVEALLRALRDTHADVRAAAAGALARSKDRRGGEHLTAALGDPDADVRVKAAVAIGELRYEPGLDAVIHALQDADVPVRTQAVRTLAKFHSPTSIPALLQATTDPVSDVRRLAARVLEQIRHPEAKAALASLVDSDDMVIRELAQRAATGR